MRRDSGVIMRRNFILCCVAAVFLFSIKIILRMLTRGSLQANPRWSTYLIYARSLSSPAFFDLLFVVFRRHEKLLWSPSHSPLSHQFSSPRKKNTTIRERENVKFFFFTSPPLFKQFFFRVDLIAVEESQWIFSLLFYSWHKKFHRWTCSAEEICSTRKSQWSSSEI